MRAETHATRKRGDPEVTRRNALIVGITGITGFNLARALVDDGWSVVGVSRRPGPPIPGVTQLAADVTDQDALVQAVSGLDVSHLFFASWSRQATEADNSRVNAGMLRNALEAVGTTSNLEHAALVTGLKHYLGPFEAYAKTPIETPFLESFARLPYPNFYYDQEDVLFAAAERLSFTWSVHRSSTIIGWAIGNVMNMGVTLAVYGSICRATGEPFVFPGSPEQWNGIVDVVDARLLGDHLKWAATEPRARNQAFNVTNGDVFRWRQMWPRLAGAFGIEAAPYPGKPTPLDGRMGGADEVWTGLVSEYGLVDHRASELASWWHTDADLGRGMETFADMSKSREAGFSEYQSSVGSFLDLFEELRTARIIPSFNSPEPGRVLA
ncbi:MAG: SDR family oxidoreductase [Candidatus Nanopelagicales bacterium]